MLRRQISGGAYFTQCSLHTTVLVYKIIDEVSRVLVLQRLLVHPRLLEEPLQVGVHILQIESPVRIPAHVADVLKVRRPPDVLFPQSLFLVPLSSATAARARLLPRRPLLLHGLLR